MRTEWRRALYGCTIFTSALLLFLVQPMMARAILPWYGGSAGVWTTSMLFFQALLLAGYWYAHRTASGLGPRPQAWLHAALLAGSVVLLPVIPTAPWKPAGDPVLGILVLLTLTVGLPYFLLSTTTPLLQSWYAREGGGSPYRLFAVSNFASLAALLAYPVAIEPALPLRTQLVLWSAGYAAFAVLCAASAVASMGRKPVAGPKGHAAPWRDRFVWIALAACPSALWLATANQVSQSIAPIPFIWILPLSVYLLSLILCFDRDGWYSPRLFRLILPVALLAASLGLGQQWTAPLPRTLALLTIGLFTCCMFCHGELAARKPAPEQLTSYYLMVAIGGALGGAFVAVGAPRLLNGYYELQVSLIGCLVLGFTLLYGKARPIHMLRLTIVALIGVGIGLYLRGSTADRVFNARNFYSVLEIADGKGPDALRTLYHGAIIHGSQYLDPGRSRIAGSYYGKSSGVELALRRGTPGRRVGVVGLGAGTLATYGRPGDTYRFYEINPLVVEIANRYFRYLRETPARVETVLGDARLTMAEEPPQAYDVLVVDAFSGDSIPVHLLTREAFALYFRHLKPDGTLAVHLTNRYLDLVPVVEGVSKALGRTCLVVRGTGDGGSLYSSVWTLVTGDPQVTAAASPISAAARRSRTVPVWTDDYSNLFRLLR